MLFPKKEFSQRFTSMRYLADKQAEGNDGDGYGDGAKDVQQEVGVMRIEPCSHER